MKLSDYLSRHGITDTEFAERIGCDRTTVLRWRNEKVLPEREQMRRIGEATGGAVTANDFYGMSEPGRQAS